eukprot:TRINITY_DN57060_c0_g1_i1.p1 TRINITY_DN57060_c0_g1~~TRINITY_DN57060_c0_g1_i1.p1  ORF type:complete len:367 (-),score=37.27 TRINITY_DN57060_c0_g1_i1:109-1209(-)
MAGLELGASLLGVLQSVIYHRNELEWSEIDYYLQVRQVHIDTLNNMREDLRDLYQMHKGKIDNSLIVATLMLGIGFGFAVEGTFPPAGKVGVYEGLWRVIYAFVAALALIMPFGSMLCLVECRRRLDYFMDRFTHEFYDKLKRRTETFVDDTSSRRNITKSVGSYTNDLPKAVVPPHRLFLFTFESLFRPFVCLRRMPANDALKDGLLALPAAEESSFKLTMPIAKDAVETTCWSPRIVSSTEIGRDMIRVYNLHNDYMHWWNVWCSRNFRVANIMQTAALIFNVLCSVILLGMYFQDNYSETPWMWRSYVIIVGLGLCVAILYLIVVRLGGPGSPHHRAQNLPEWMVRAGTVKKQSRNSLALNGS